MRYRKPNGRQTTQRGLTRKRDADAWAADNAVRVAKGQYNDPSAGRIKVGVLTDDWLATKTGISAKTRVNYQDAIKRIKSTGELADVSVSDVTPAVIRRWVIAATAEYSPKTVQNTFAVLSQVFKQAQLDGRIHANPCSGIKRPKVTRNPDLLVLDAAQVMAMAEEAGRYRAAVLLMVLAGLRWSEMAASNGET